MHLNAEIRSGKLAYCTHSYIAECQSDKWNCHYFWDTPVLNKLRFNDV